MLEGDGWTLGSMESPDGTHQIVEGRPLTDEEREQIPLAMARLRKFSGHALTGQLVEAVNALNALLNELPTVAQDEFLRGLYRANLNSKVSAALTAFTNFRAAIESDAGGLVLPFPSGSSAPANFQTLYREHPEFRLIWMLRNLDQHRPPASAAISVSADRDPATGDARVRPMIDPLSVCASGVAAADTPLRRRQWEECAALWGDRPGPVDFRAVLRSAYDACQVVLASYVNEAESLILADIEFIARLAAEVEPLGSARALRVVRSEGGESISVSQVHLDVLAFGDAILTLDAARTALGKPSLADDGLLARRDENL